MSWRAFLVVALSVASLAVVVPPVFSTFPTAYTGAHVDRHATPLTLQAVDAGSPAAHAGLRTGDVIGCINTRDRTMLATFFDQSAYEPDAIHLCVKNEIPARALRFYAAKGPASTPFYGTMTMAVLRVVAYVVFLIVGCLLVISRPSLTTWLLFFYCFSTVPAAAAYQALTIWPAGAYALLVTFLSPSASVGTALLLLFSLVVPDDRMPRGWRALLFWLTVAATVAATAWHLLYGALVTGFISPLDPLTVSFTRIVTVVVVLAVVARLLTMQAAERARFSWAAAAIIAGVIANDLRQEANVWGGLFGTLTVLMPLTLMYAILRRHVIDIRFVISKALVYGFFMTTIFALVAAADWAATRYLAELRVALALDAVIAITLGITMHRVTPLIENAVDSVIYGSKHRAETYLTRLARTLPRATREETIDIALVEDPYARLDLTMAALFKKNGSGYALTSASGWENGLRTLIDRDHDVVRFLLAERARVTLADLNGHARLAFEGSAAFPAVAIPIFDGDDLVGFSAYGHHRDGTKVDPDELAVLERLADSAGQAYVRVENARLRALLDHAPTVAVSS